MKQKIKPVLFFTLLVFTNNLFAQISDNLVINDSIVKAYKTQADTTPIFVRSQVEMSEQTLRKALDAQPAFGVHKDVFFTTGIPLNKTINKNTADAMFQISFRQRLTKSYLPFNSFIYLTYSQKSFWDVYASSSPFKDNNYNPGLGLGRYILDKDKLMGATFVQIEHESNGRDSIDSRSWNFLSFSLKYFFNLRLSLSVKAWIPFVDGRENKDLIDYRGLATFWTNYISREGDWWISAEITPRKGWGNANTTLGVAYRLSKNFNQYLFLRFYNGKGDSLLDYNKYEMNVRFGICIKPDFYSIF